jgi:hypothetical protein
MALRATVLASSFAWAVTSFAWPTAAEATPVASSFAASVTEVAADAADDELSPEVSAVDAVGELAIVGLVVPFDMTFSSTTRPEP